MASPFKFFRKYSGGMMVIMVILSMLLFTLTDLFTDPGANLWLLGVLVGGAVFGTAGVGQGKWLQWGIGGALLGAALGFILPGFVSGGGLATSLGVIDEEEIYDLESRRMVANQFVYQITEATFGEGSGRFATQFGFGHRSNREDVIFGKLLRAEADRIGITVDAGMVGEYLKRIMNEKLTREDYVQSRNNLTYQRAQLDDDTLISILTDEIKARMAYQVLRPRKTSLPPAPEVYWSYFRRLNVRQQLELSALDVDDFLEEVGEPTDAEVGELFAQYNRRFPNQDEPGSPGFRLPFRARIAYLEVDSKSVEAEVDDVTDEQIETFYNENKETPLIRRPVIPDFDDATRPSGADPQKPTDEEASAVPDTDKPTEETKPAAPESDKPADPAADKPTEATKPADPATEKPAAEGTTPKPDEATPPKAETPAEPASDAAAEAPPGDSCSPLEPDEEQAADASENAPVTSEPTSDEAAPADDKPADDKPADDKPADDKPADDKPADDKPADDKPADDKPADDKPADDKPADDKPADDKPADDKPADDKPADDKPADDKPADDKPADDKPADDKPADDKPADDKPADDKPADDKPADDKPADDKPAGSGQPTLTIPAVPDTPEIAPDKKAPELEYEYRELDDELKAEIRDEITRQRVREEIDERMRKAISQMETMASARSKERFALIEQDPAKYEGGQEQQEALKQLREQMQSYHETLNAQLEKYAADNGLAYVATPLVTYAELLEEEVYPIGSATEPNDNPMFAAQSPNVAATAFQSFSADEQNNDAQLFLVRRAQRRAGGLDGGDYHYAWWAIDFSPSHIPTLDEPGIREIVVRQWKRLQARELVTKRGEELAQKVRDGLAGEADQKQDMVTTLTDETATGSEDGAALAVRMTRPFSWLRTSTASPMSLQRQQASQSPIQFEDTVGGQLEKVGDEFMNSVFNEMVDEDVDVLPNFDRSKYYVVHVTGRFPTPEVGEDGLRDRFADEGKLASFVRSPMIGVMEQQLAGPVNLKWERNLWLRYDIDPDSEPDEDE